MGVVRAVTLKLTLQSKLPSEFYIAVPQEGMLLSSSMSRHVGNRYHQLVEERASPLFHSMQ